MAKIKSTLDLVMERTKNISMTEDEKEALHRKEWVDKVRGWVWKMMDRTITTSEVRASLKSGISAYSALENILRQELVEHIDPDGDNTLVFQALDEILGVDATPFRESISAFQRALDVHRKEHEDRVRAELEAGGISGTAVMPNLEHDDVWIGSQKKLREEQLRALRGI
jgi:hypothetical protein